MRSSVETHEAPCPELIRRAVADQVGPLMKRFDPDGFFRQENPGAYYLYDSQGIYPLAYVYSVKFPGNAYHGDSVILDAARRLGDHIAARTSPSGEIEYHSFGNVGKSVDQRLLTFWMDAYVLIRGELPPATRARWEAAMLRSLGHLALRVDGYLDQERFNSLSFGTSPNHASLYASTLLLGADLFRRKDWRTLALAFMDRFVRLQSPDGYWPEGDGPVGVYNTVSLAGVARVEALCPRPGFRRALARSLEYCRTIMYPDFTFVTLIDKRQHYSALPFLWGMFGFTHWPEGRALLHEACRARLRADKPFGGEEAARWLENFAHCRPGPVPRYRPWTGRRSLGNYAAFFRRNGWQWNFSVHTSVVNPRNPYRLDQQNVLSLRHADAGIVVADSQDKFRPEHYTFLLNGPDDLGVFCGGRIGSLAHPPYVEAIYSNGLIGKVSVDAVNRRRVIVRAVEKSIAAARKGSRKRKDGPADGLCFNLPLYVHRGATVCVGRRDYVLAGKRLAIPVPAGQRVAILNGKVGLMPRSAAVLRYPCKPFNPYARDNKSAPATWFARLELPMTGAPRAAEVEIRARS